MADWTKVNKIRRTVEMYYKRNDEKNNIDFTTYDGFVTEMRNDWERAGFDVTNPDHLYLMWAGLAMTCAATAHLMSECSSKEEVQGALKVMGTYGNMTGLFLREMTKYVDAPAIVFDVKGDLSE